MGDGEGVRDGGRKGGRGTAIRLARDDSDHVQDDDAARRGGRLALTEGG